MRMQQRTARAPAPALDARHGALRRMTEIIRRVLPMLRMLRGRGADPHRAVTTVTTAGHTRDAERCCGGTRALAGQYARLAAGRGLAVTLLLVASIGVAPPVPAVTLTVDTATDAVDAAPGDGTCDAAPPDRRCTLRAAVQEANALPGADEIVVPAGSYLLTIRGRDEDDGATGDLDIRSEG
jgi:CSLREA domain-containing protein